MKFKSVMVYYCLVLSSAKDLSSNNVIIFWVCIVCRGVQIQYKVGNKNKNKLKS